jgi:hypothetical protein
VATSEPNLSPSSAPLVPPVLLRCPLSSWCLPPCTEWGDVNHKSFREHVWALGVVAEGPAIDKIFDEMDDDGGGTLDADELKEGMKLLVDSAKKNETSSAGLEKHALALRKVAAAQITGLAKKEKEYLERKARLDAEAAAAEAERLEKERLAAEEAARIQAEHEAAKRAEKAALLAKIAAQKQAARGDKPKIAYNNGGGDGEEVHERVSVAAQNAEERRKAEENWALVKSKFKRRWRPPGLMIY